MNATFKGGAIKAAVAYALATATPQFVEGVSTVAGCPVGFGGYIGEAVSGVESGFPIDIKSAIVNQPNLQIITDKIERFKLSHGINCGLNIDEAAITNALNKANPDGTAAAAFRAAFAPSAPADSAANPFAAEGLSQEQADAILAWSREPAQK